MLVFLRLWKFLNLNDDWKGGDKNMDFGQAIKAMKARMKRKDECLCCSKRACYERVVSVDGKIYDEVSCLDHVKDLHKHSDASAKGIEKNFISSTGRQKRGVQFMTPNKGMSGKEGR